MIIADYQFAIVSNLFAAIFLGEFFGTAMLILLGNGVGSAVNLKKMFAANTRANWVLITFGWGFGVLFGVIIAQAFWSGAYLNPAVAIFDWFSRLGKSQIITQFLDKDLDFDIISKGMLTGAFFLAIFAEFTGAFFGQAILNLINWKHYQDPENSAATVRNFHCTAPAYREKAGVYNYLYEFIGTLVLVGVIAALGKGLNSKAYSALGAIPVTFLVVSIGMSLGSSTGYAINPARDLAPRIMYYLLPLKNKASADFKYGIIPVLGPLSAGALVGIIALLASTA